MSDLREQRRLRRQQKEEEEKKLEEERLARREKRLGPRRDSTRIMSESPASSPVTTRSITTTSSSDLLASQGEGSVDIEPQLTRGSTLSIAERRAERERERQRQEEEDKQRSEQRKLRRERRLAELSGGEQRSSSTPNIFITDDASTLTNSTPLTTSPPSLRSSFTDDSPQPASLSSVSSSLSIPEESTSSFPASPTPTPIDRSPNPAAELAEKPRFRRQSTKLIEQQLQQEEKQREEEKRRRKEEREKKSRERKEQTDSELDSIKKRTVEAQEKVEQQIRERERKQKIQDERARIEALYIKNRLFNDVAFPRFYRFTLEDLIDETTQLPSLSALSSHLFNEGRLLKETAHYLIDKTSQILHKEGNIVTITTPVVVVGDIHGQYYDLMCLLKNIEFPLKYTILFLGDYVDRGQFGTECLLYLYALKLNYPTMVYLLRGNHECRSITKHYNFMKECLIKYDHDFYDQAMASFDRLPLAAMIKTKRMGNILCVHGGIGPELATIEDIEKLDRFQEPPETGPLCDLLWADPIPFEEEDLSTEDQLKELEALRFEVNSSRGCSYYFGYKAVTEFLERNSVSMIIRAHEVQMNGFKEHWFAHGEGSRLYTLQDLPRDDSYSHYNQNQHDKPVNPLLANDKQIYLPYLITVFSAPNYGDQYNNLGGFLTIFDDHYKFSSLRSVPHPYCLPNFENIFTFTIPFVTEKVLLLLQELIVDVKEESSIPSEEQAIEEIVFNDKERILGTVQNLQDTMDVGPEIRQQLAQQEVNLQDPTQQNVPSTPSPMDLEPVQKALILQEADKEKALEKELDIEIEEIDFTQPPESRKRDQPSVTTEQMNTVEKRVRRGSETTAPESAHLSLSSSPRKVENPPESPRTLRDSLTISTGSPGGSLRDSLNSSLTIGSSPIANLSLRDSLPSAEKDAPLLSPNHLSAHRGVSPRAKPRPLSPIHTPQREDNLSDQSRGSSLEMSTSSESGSSQEGEPPKRIGRRSTVSGLERRGHRRHFSVGGALILGVEKSLSPSAAGTNPQPPPSPIPTINTSSSSTLPSSISLLPLNSPRYPEIPLSPMIVRNERRRTVGESFATQPTKNEGTLLQNLPKGLDLASKRTFSGSGASLFSSGGALELSQKFQSKLRESAHAIDNNAEDNQNQNNGNSKSENNDEKQKSETIESEQLRSSSETNTTPSTTPLGTKRGSSLKGSLVRSSKPKGVSFSIASEVNAQNDDPMVIDQSSQDSHSRDESHINKNENTPQQNIENRSNPIPTSSPSAQPRNSGPGAKESLVEKDSPLKNTVSASGNVGSGGATDTSPPNYAYTSPRTIEMQPIARDNYYDRPNDSFSKFNDNDKNPLMISQKMDLTNFELGVEEDLEKANHIDSLTKPNVESFASAHNQKDATEKNGFTIFIPTDPTPPQSASDRVSPSSSAQPHVLSTPSSLLSPSRSSTSGNEATMLALQKEKEREREKDLEKERGEKARYRARESSQEDEEDDDDESKEKRALLKGRSSFSSSASHHTSAVSDPESSSVSTPLHPNSDSTLVSAPFSKWVKVFGLLFCGLSIGMASVFIFHQFSVI